MWLQLSHRHCSGPQTTAIPLTELSSECQTVRHHQPLQQRPFCRKHAGTETKQDINPVLTAPSNAAQRVHRAPSEHTHSPELGSVMPLCTEDVCNGSKAAASSGIRWVKHSAVGENALLGLRCGQHTPAQQPHNAGLPFLPLMNEKLSRQQATRRHKPGL